MYNKEADMMEQVIYQDIPDGRKEPIFALSKRLIFPNNPIVNSIGVNKLPNKRVSEKSNGKFINVLGGTVISYNSTQGLLISTSSRIDTSQPIEISLKKHLCLYRSDVPMLNISQIMDEHHRLTFLNWFSIFRQGKYALPQIVTQNLGENLCRGAGP